MASFRLSLSSLMNGLLASLAIEARRSPRSAADLGAALRAAHLSADDAAIRDALTGLLDKGYVAQFVPLPDGGLRLTMTPSGLRRAAAITEGRMAPDPTDPLDLAGAGAYRSSLEGRWLRASRGLVLLNGYDSEADMVQAVKDIGAECYVVPEGRLEFHQRLLAHGSLHDFVYPVYRHRTREPIWVSESARLVTARGGREPLWYEGTVQEVPGPRPSGWPGRCDAGNVSGHASFGGAAPGPANDWTPRSAGAGGVPWREMSGERDGSGSRARTYDRAVNSRLLYH